MFSFLKIFGVGKNSMINTNCVESFPDAAPEPVVVNPATGEIMIGGIGGVDTSGNPYGMDHSFDDSWGSSSISNDDWNNNYSSFDQH